MDVARQGPSEQSALWNGPVGSAWVDTQDLLDHMLEPLERLLLAAVRARSPSQVLDVGCGTGSTTLAVARLLGTRGRSVGIDISLAMIGTARARAAAEGTAAMFIGADAQHHALEPASFDMIVSRFGVMFFDDPVAAFTNLRRAATDDAALWFVAWRGAADNPFMTTAERAAAPLLANMPARQPGAPGQFAFADPDRVRHILQQSGWSRIDIQPIDVACTLPESGLVRYLTRLGPLGRALAQVDEPTGTRVIQAARAAFDPYVHGPEVRFNAACWMVGAQASASAASKGAANA